MGLRFIWQTKPPLSTFLLILRLPYFKNFSFHITKWWYPKWLGPSENVPVEQIVPCLCIPISPPFNSPDTGIFHNWYNTKQFPIYLVVIARLAHLRVLLRGGKVWSLLPKPTTHIACTAKTYNRFYQFTSASKLAHFGVWGVWLAERTIQFFCQLPFRLPGTTMNNLQ